MSVNKSVRIGVVDSGVGGLTILQAIQKRIPSASFVYCSDNQNFPYGPKSSDEVQQHTLTMVDRLLAVEDIDVLVVACNTASTVALEALRKKLTIPVVGVVPAIKPAAEISETKVIGLLATPGTVNRVYTAELIKNFASHCQVLKVGSSPLVQVAEEAIHGEDIEELVIEGELDPFKNHDMFSSMDTVVLACTHFPLLLPSLKKALPSVKHWIDSGDAVASRVVSVLEEAGLFVSESTQTPQSLAYFTSPLDEASNLQEALLSEFNFLRVTVLIQL